MPTRVVTIDINDHNIIIYIGDKPKTICKIYGDINII